MKRYLLFAGNNYYPSGGWDDYQDSYDTIELAVAAGRGKNGNGRSNHDWYHVIDTQTWQRVSEG